PEGVSQRNRRGLRRAHPARLAIALVLRLRVLPAAGGDEHHQTDNQQGDSPGLGAAKRNHPGGILARSSGADRVMDPIATRLIVIVFFIAIVYNLGAALYFMMNDKGDGKRMAWALSRRIGLSVLLILMVMLDIWTGQIEPHGSYPGQYSPRDPVHSNGCAAPGDAIVPVAPAARLIRARRRTGTGPA